MIDEKIVDVSGKEKRLAVVTGGEPLDETGLPVTLYTGEFGPSSFTFNSNSGLMESYPIWWIGFADSEEDAIAKCRENWRTRKK